MDRGRRCRRPDGEAPTAPGIRRDADTARVRITDEQVERLREAGWTDARIAEAVYDGALFSLFVRLADAFDIHPDPAYDAAGVPGVLS